MVGENLELCWCSQLLGNIQILMEKLKTEPAEFYLIFDECTEFKYYYFYLCIQI